MWHTEKMEFCDDLKVSFWFLCEDQCKYILYIIDNKIYKTNIKRTQWKKTIPRLHVG